MLEPPDTVPFTFLLSGVGAKVFEKESVDLIHIESWN
jgi:hypothetical protein